MDRAHRFCARANLVPYDQALAIAPFEDAPELGHLYHESGLAAGHVVMRLNPGENPVEG